MENTCPYSPRELEMVQDKEVFVGTPLYQKNFDLWRWCYSWKTDETFRARLEAEYKGRSKMPPAAPSELPVPSPQPIRYRENDASANLTEKDMRLAPVGVVIMLITKALDAVR